MMSSHRKRPLSGRVPLFSTQRSSFVQLSFVSLFLSFHVVLCLRPVMSFLRSCVEAVRRFVHTSLFYTCLQQTPLTLLRVHFSDDSAHLDGIVGVRKLLHKISSLVAANIHGHLRLILQARSHFVRFNDSHNIINIHVVARFFLPLNERA